ncbi:MAG: hypothetical protein P4L77_12200 [Sulfuriferula sp.]|nr:hypothetical protein [Sulfuriferula sp.]
MATASSNPTPTSGITGSLHYGGSLNPKTAALGPKPQAGRQFKVQKRLETIVRLENAGFGEGAAAAMLCISVPRLRTIKKSPDYIATRAKLTHGIIINWDGELTQIKEQRKEILTAQLPAALAVIANELQRPAITLAERRHQVDIAKDLLDREGTFAKVSRAEIKPVDKFDFEKTDVVSTSIISAIRGVAAPLAATEAGQTEIDKTIELSRSFSNSATLSQTDQEQALKMLEEEARSKGIVLADTRGEEE